MLKKREKNYYNVWKYGMVERVALEAFRAVARTSPGRTRLSIMHSLNRGRTHEWNLKTKKQKHTGECCSHTNTNFATDIRFARNLNTEQLIRQWIVNSDENIAKLGWYYASSVIAAVFRPDNVNFVVAQMSRLYQSI